MKNRILLMALSLILAGVGTINAQSNKISFEEYKLDNGLHVILHQDNSTPIVTVSVMYHVGSKNESPELTGFAHFFEHLMFEGTENIARGEYSNYVEKAGGTLNANTSQDRTYYYEIMPSNQLEMGLWLESERMLHAKVDAIGIKTQKQVVTEEMKQRVDSQPYGTLLEEITKRVYKDHPYKWRVLGAADHIFGAKDEDFKNFYKDFYVPNNAVLVLAGDIDKAEAKKLVSKYFSEIPKGKKEIYRPEPAKIEATGEIRDVIYDNVQLPLIAQAYRTPAMGTDDYYALSMLNTLLSGGKSSRMYKSLVDEQQKALETASFPMPLEHPGFTLVYALPNMGVDCDKLEAAMDAEVDKVKNEMISEREFQKLRNQVENGFVNSNVKLEKRAENLATNYTYYKNANLINTELDKYLAVTREDIKRVANKYFNKDNRVVLYYLPKSQKN